MLTNIVVAIVKACTRFAPFVLVLSLAVAIGSTYYAVRHFAINTDINTLISPDLDWRKRDIQFERAFDREKLILAVVEAASPELAGSAAEALTEKLKADTKNFEAVQPLGSGEFFARNGLLFLPVEEVAKTTAQLEAAAPLIEIMAGDPSIRGLTGALETGLAGVKRGQAKLDNGARAFDLIAQTVETVLAKGNATFSWRELVSQKPLTDADKRSFIELKPIIDYEALEPGKDATDAIRKAASELKLAEDYHARVRLTGPIPIADIEASMVAAGIDRRDADSWIDEVGSPRRYSFQLAFTGTAFSHSEETPDMAMQVGESGTFTLSGNELVLTNASDTYTLQTTLADDELSLRWVSSTEQGTPQDQAKHRRYTIAFYCSAPFRRQP